MIPNTDKYKKLNNFLLNNKLEMYNIFYGDLDCHYRIEGTNKVKTFVCEPYKGCCFMWYENCSFLNNENEDVKMSEDDFVKELEKLILNTNKND